MNGSEIDLFVSFFVWKYTQFVMTLILNESVCEREKMCKIEYIIQNTDTYIEYCIQ